MRFSSGAATGLVNVPDRAALLSQVHQRLTARQGFAVATLNLDHLVKIAASPAFATAYAEQDLIVADGRPVAWLLRLSGQTIRVAPGSELILPLCGVALAAGARVALVGSTVEVLDKAASALSAAHPGLQICAKIAPSRGFDPDGAEAARIFQDLDRAGAQLVFLALGAPKQERLAARGRGVLPDIGFVSIGAGLDFIAGHQQRAPRWMRVIALEWLWRMLQDPGRMIPRYAKCFAILPRLTVLAVRSRLRQAHEG